MMEKVQVQSYCRCSAETYDNKPKPSCEHCQGTGYRYDWVSVSELFDMMTREDED